MSTTEVGRIADLIKNLGVPVVAMAVLMWFSWSTIQWERDLMLPAIERSNILAERNSQLFEVLMNRIESPPTRPNRTDPTE